MASRLSHSLGTTWRVIIYTAVLAPVTPVTGKWLCVNPANESRAEQSTVPTAENILAADIYIQTVMSVYIARAMHSTAVHILSVVNLFG